MAEARCYCHARYPALPASIHTAAAEHVVLSLQLLLPRPVTYDRDGEEWREVDFISLARNISYMLRFDGRGRPNSSAMNWPMQRQPICAPTSRRGATASLRRCGHIARIRQARGVSRAAGEH
jgi:hypothetical protein